MFFKRINLKTEVVTGLCPICNQESIMISLINASYRCMNCGESLEQKINGVISYLPIGSSTHSHKPDLKNG